MEQLTRMAGKELFAIVLAAGRGSRYGAVKQVEQYAGEALVRRAVRLAETVCGDKTILVTGYAWRRVSEAAGTLRGFMVVNSAHASGMAASIACGVRAAKHGADGVLLLLADQPLVDPAHLETLMAEWRRNSDDPVATGYRGIAGPPVIFPSRLFPALESLQGDNGARPVLDAERDSLTIVACERAAVDIDRVEDLRELERRAGEGRTTS